MSPGGLMARGEASLPPPVADKGSEASAQRSKLHAAPRHKAVLGTASGQAAKPRELVQVRFAWCSFLFRAKRTSPLPTFRGDEPGWAQEAKHGASRIV